MVWYRKSVVSGLTMACRGLQRRALDGAGWEVPSVVEWLQRWHAPGTKLGTPLGAAVLLSAAVGCSDGVPRAPATERWTVRGWEPCSAPPWAATERWTARG